MVVLVRLYRQWLLPPGVLVNVQVLVAGKPFQQLPVDKAHVGRVIVPAMGAVGAAFTVAFTAVLLPVTQPFARRHNMLYSKVNPFIVVKLIPVPKITPSDAS